MSERVHIVSDIDHPERRWRCAALRCGCGNEAYAKKTCAYYGPLVAFNPFHLGIPPKPAAPMQWYLDQLGDA